MPTKWPTYPADEVSELVQAAVEYWQPRDTRMYNEQLLHELERDEPLPGRATTVDNSPYNVINIGTGVLSRNPPYISVRTPFDSEPLRKRANLIEQVAMGVLGKLNTLQMNRGMGLFVPTLAYSVLLRGWHAVRVAFPKKRDGDPLRLIRVYDPMTCYPGPYSSDGLLWAARKYVLPYGAAAAAYPEWKVEEGRKPFDPVEIIDFYDGVNEIVLIDDAPVRTVKHGFDRCPLIVGPATPYIFQGAAGLTATTYVDKMGRGLLFGIKDLQAYYNELLSNIGTLIKKYALPTVLVRTRDGTAREIALGAGDVTPLQLTDIVEVIQMPGSPPDLVVVLNAVFGAIQRATFSSIMYGDAPAGTPATGMALLGQHSQVILEPYVRDMEAVLVEMFRRILWYLEKNKVNLGDLSGEDAQGQSFVLSDFDYTDIAGDHEIVVKMKPSLPQDMQQLYAIASMATNPSNKLVSAEYAREEIISVQNPSRERDRLYKEFAQDLPQVRLALAYQALIDEGKPEAAAFLATAAQALGVQMGGGGAPTPPGAAFGGAPPGTPANQR